MELWHELDLSVVTEMTAKAHRWATVLVEAVNPDGYNLLMNNGVAAGQDVFHATCTSRLDRWAMATTGSAASTRF